MEHLSIGGNKNMKVWRLRANVNNYDSLIFTNDMDSDKFFEYGFSGKEIGHLWVPLEVKIYEYKQESDCPSLPGVPVFNSKAVDIVSKFLEGNVELLPLKFIDDNDKYYLVNVVNIKDCIDYKDAVVKYFPNTTKVMKFMKYAFIEEKVKDSHIFKITEFPKSYVFVSDEFRDCIMENQLKGFLFEKVWNSENK